MIRAVVDTNILVRAVLRPLGTLGTLPRMIRGRYFVALYSDETLDELSSVLARPRLKTKYGVRDEDVESLVVAFLHFGEAVTPQRRIAVCRDPKDDVFLEIAVAGKADVIVTTDDDLLVLDPFEGIRIMAPSGFRKMLSDSEAEEQD